jgi:hypothetical protein
MAGMNTAWCKVYSTPDRVQAEIIHGMLETAGIACTLVNRQDSSYIFLGEIELHVPCEQADKAAVYIKEVMDGPTEK